MSSEVNNNALDINAMINMTSAAIGFFLLLFSPARDTIALMGLLFGFLLLIILNGILIIAELETEKKKKLRYTIAGASVIPLLGALFGHFYAPFSITPFIFYIIVAIFITICLISSLFSINKN